MTVETPEPLPPEHRTGDPLPIVLGVQELLTDLDMQPDRIRVLIESMREQLHRYAEEHELTPTEQPHVELVLRATMQTERAT